MIATPPSRSGAYAAELRHEVVVGAHHLEVDGVVGHAGDPLRDGAGEHHLGVDAVEIHLPDPRLRVVAAGVDVLEAAPAAELFGTAAGARAPTERHRTRRGLHHPRVALGQRLDARHGVADLGRTPATSTDHPARCSDHRRRSIGTAGPRSSCHSAPFAVTVLGMMLLAERHGHGAARSHRIRLRRGSLNDGVGVRSAARSGRSPWPTGSS